MDEKNYGVQVLSIERLDRQTLRWKNYVARTGKDYQTTKRYDEYDVDSNNSRLYEIEVDFYGRKRSFEITCNGWSSSYDEMFTETMDHLRDELNCILIDNIDEAKNMFLEANYNVRMSSPKYY